MGVPVHTSQILVIWRWMSANVGTGEAAEWWNRAVVCGVGDSRACCALFGGVLRVGTYSRWGRGEEPLRQVAVRLEICSRGKRGKGEKIRRVG